MTNAELLAKIKTEIERRIIYAIGFRDNVEQEERASFFNGEAVALKHLLSFLDTLEPEKPMDQDGLEEEIDRLWESFADEMEGPHNLFDIYARLAHHFAQWGADHTPLPEDTVLFNKGVDEGKRLMMMEAVEGEVVKDISNKLAVTAKINLDGFKFGDKVRIIVIPNTEEK